jgi:hypothetical protein
MVYQCTLIRIYLHCTLAFAVGCDVHLSSILHAYVQPIDRLPDSRSTISVFHRTTAEDSPFKSRHTKNIQTSHSLLHSAVIIPSIRSWNFFSFAFPFYFLFRFSSFVISGF